MMAAPNVFDNTEPHLQTYRGRLAPTPTGLLHLGHARTFWVAYSRARMRKQGHLLLRDENLDRHRCKPEFSQAALDDLHWLGLDWDAGPDRDGPDAPYQQSQRHVRGDYLRAWNRLKEGGWIYPCHRSRRDVLSASLAPHEEEENSEPVFPPAWRPPPHSGREAACPGSVNWRFRVPDGESIQFLDFQAGPCSFQAGHDFGDFLVWRKDGLPAYELAVVVDDASMRITEVVRGEDLLKSTARQLLLYRALGASPPAFFHCPLLRDDSGRRLAKRHQSLALRELRAMGADPNELTASFPHQIPSWNRF